MMLKNKNPRFAVEGLVNSNQQSNFSKLRQFAQQIGHRITTKTKWLLVRTSAHGLIPPSLCKNLIKILGLKHK